MVTNLRVSGRILQNGLAVDFLVFKAPIYSIIAAQLQSSCKRQFRRQP
jgi:hypothetical protein